MMANVRYQLLFQLGFITKLPKGYDNFFFCQISVMAI